MPIRENIGNGITKQNHEETERVLSLLVKNHHRLNGFEKRVLATCLDLNDRKMMLSEKQADILENAEQRISRELSS